MRGAFLFLLVLLISFFLIGFASASYVEHEPVIIRHDVEGNSASNPLVIEGYEISNPKGPCIFIEGVEHVVIRNNYLHDCGTDISAELIANNPRDDDCLGGGTDFMETGALNLFRVGSVKIYGNKLENNDYGMRVEGHDKMLNGVEIFDNIVYKSHRNYFIWVKDGNNISIYNNDIRHNGLSQFFDNAALERIFDGEDLGCMDGRSQGIIVFSCKDVKIYNNFILNSSSDGIGIMGAPGDPYNSVNPSRNVEVYDNEVVESGEQGIWLAGAHNVSIYRNKVYQSKHRIDEQGGSSGIMLETDSINVRIFENELYYNDMYGVGITAGTNVSIYNNEISYNGDGAIGITYLDYVGHEGIRNINISNNFIHNNRKNAIEFLTDGFENILIDGNVFEKNGGNPIHHGFYEDHDFSLHLEDWVLQYESILHVNSKEMEREITIGENVGFFKGMNFSKIDEGNEVSEEQKDFSEIKQKEPTGIFYIIEQLGESWKATLGVSIFLVVVIVLILYYRRENKSGI